MYWTLVYLMTVFKLLLFHLQWQYWIRNKRSMGHIAHLRNWFKSINSFVESYDDLERRKPIIFFFVIKWSLFVKPWVPFTQRCFMPSLDEIDPMVPQKKIWFCQCIFVILLLSPLGKGVALHLNKLQICFVLSLVETFLVVLEKKIFKFCQCIITIRHYLPLEKGMALYLNKLESLFSSDALCQVWLKVVLEKKIFKFLQCIFTIS